MADQNSTTIQATAPVALDGVPANYQRSIDTEQHTNLHVHGATTTFDTERKTDDSAGGVYDNRVMEMIDGALTKRKVDEDKRANARNRNRLWILAVVLLMEMFVPTLAGMHLLPMIVVKYEVLAITAPDAFLTLYAFWRKY
jgi:hypothetical protein